MKLTYRDDFVDILLSKGDSYDSTNYLALRNAVYQCCSLTDLEKIVELFIEEVSNDR